MINDCLHLLTSGQLKSSDLFASSATAEYRSVMNAMPNSGKYDPLRSAALFLESGHERGSEPRPQIIMRMCFLEASDMLLSLIVLHDAPQKRLRSFQE